MEEPDDLIHDLAAKLLEPDRSEDAEHNDTSETDSAEDLRNPGEYRVVYLTLLIMFAIFTGVCSVLGFLSHSAWGVICFVLGLGSIGLCPLLIKWR